MLQHLHGAALSNNNLLASSPTPTLLPFRVISDSPTISTDDLWPIPDLLPTGLCLLSSKSHAGARTLALQFALAIASNDPTLDRFAATPGQVLYLSFHEHERTFIARARQQLGDAPLPDNLAFTNSGSSWLEHGAATIARSLQEFTHTRLLVIDSLSSLFPPTRFWNARRKQALLDQLNHVAHEHHLCILILHSQARHSSNDPFDAIACSPLLLEAIETLLVLEHERTQAQARLSITGPLMRTHHLKLRLSTQDNLWHLSDAAPGSASSATYQDALPPNSNDNHPLSAPVPSLLAPDYNLHSGQPASPASNAAIHQDMPPDETVEMRGDIVLL